MKVYYNREVVAWLYLYISETLDKQCVFKAAFNIAQNLSIDLNDAVKLHCIIGSVLNMPVANKIDFIMHLFKLQGYKADIKSFLKESFCLKETEEENDIIYFRTFIIYLNSLELIYDENYKMVAKEANINLL